MDLRTLNAVFYEPGVIVVASLSLERAAGDTGCTIEPARSASQFRPATNKHAATGPASPPAGRPLLPLDRLITLGLGHFLAAICLGCICVSRLNNPACAFCRPWLPSSAARLAYPLLLGPCLVNPKCGLHLRVEPRFLLPLSAIGGALGKLKAACLDSAPSSASRPREHRGDVTHLIHPTPSRPVSPRSLRTGDSPLSSSSIRADHQRGHIHAHIHTHTHTRGGQTV